MSGFVKSPHYSGGTVVVGEAIHEVRVFEDLTAISDAAANHIIEAALAAAQARGRFTICLSGGNTPQRLYSSLAEEPYASRMPWAFVHVFWGDERCIPLDRPDNHYSMTSERLLSRVAIPKSHVHRIRGEAADPQDAAREYESELHSFFTPAKGDFPRFDLVLLGLGDDGHTASLYPGTKGVSERSRWVISDYVPQRSQFRVTMTFPVINNATQVCFLVTGTGKAQALRTVLEAAATEPVAPARFVKPIHGKIVWFVDREAASLLFSND